MIACFRWGLSGRPLEQRSVACVQELEEVGAGPELDRMMAELGSAKKTKA